MWPTIVILDTEKIMKIFRQYTKDQGKPIDIPDDMVDAIINCFKRKQNAELRLDDFVASILGGDYEYPLGKYIDIGIAGFILELGEVIFDQLNLHCLYDEHGFLPYRHTTPKEKGFNCVILRRIPREKYDRPMHYYQTTGKCSF